MSEKQFSHGKQKNYTHHQWKKVCQTGRTRGQILPRNMPVGHYVPHTTVKVISIQGKQLIPKGDTS